MKTTTVAIGVCLWLVAAGQVAADNLLSNSGFETGSANIGGVPTTFGQWRGDQTNYATAGGGITPFEGSKMLQFLATNAGGPAGTTNTSQYFQNVDLSPYASAVASGTATLSTTAMFNRVLGDAQTDTAFGFLVDARSGTPSLSTLLSQGVGLTFTDGDPNSWQPATLSNFPVPVGTTFIRFELQAFENVANDAVDPEFDGHYADNIQLFLSSAGPPPPSAGFNLTNVTQRTYAQSVANESSFPNNFSATDDEESFSSVASVTADAATPSYVGHGEAQASYTVSPTVLHLEGRGAGSGMIGQNGGAAGYGSVQFSADQSFDFGTWAHIVGTFTRNDSNPTGSITASMSLGNYNQSLQSGVNGTHSFDDFVQLGGQAHLSVNLTESQPSGNINGSYSGESAYDITVTLVSSGSGASQQDSVLPDSGGGDQPFQFTVLPGPGKWFDPPATYGFEYEVTFGAPFTVVGLPLGIEPGGDGEYTVSGDFGSVIVSEGSTYFFDSPVTSFTITGIDGAGSGEDPLAFPTYLAFYQDGFSNFTMTPLLQAEAVPEPATLVLAALGLLGLALVAVRKKYRRA